MTATHPEPIPSPPPRLLVFLGLLGLCLLVYLPAVWSAGFLGFDDNFFFGPEDHVMRAGLAAVLTQPIANAYLPVAHASLWLDATLAGGAPWLPHLTAILLHAAVATVVAQLLLALRVAALPAIGAAALFAMHPALAESVAWVSGRKDLLSGLFVGLALLQCRRVLERPAAWRWGWLACCAVLAMYSKATAVVLPWLAVLVVWGAPAGSARWRPPLLLLLVTLPIAYHHQAIAAAEGTLQAGALASRLPQVPGALGHYVLTAGWPTRLNVLYPEQQTLARFASFDAALLGALAVALLWLLVGLLRPRGRLVAGGWLAFFVALLPFNTAWPASSIAAADRYLYLALPGAALALLASAAAVHRRGPWLLLALVLPTLAWLTAGRARDFRSDEQLWTSSLAVDPANAVARYNLTSQRLATGLPFATARAELEAAVAAARYPVHELRARSLLVTLCLRAAEYPAAAEHARGAIVAAEAQLALETQASRRLEAARWLLQARLAALEPLRMVGAFAAADALCALVQSEHPDHPAVVAFVALRQLRELLAARAAAGATGPVAAEDPVALAVAGPLAAALAAHPDHAMLLLAKAAWDQISDRALSAIRHYQLAQAADPRCVEAWLGAARLLRERECYEDAARYAHDGFRQVPDPALLQEQALALVGLGRLDDAIANLEAYLRVRPLDTDTPKVLSNLLVGRAYNKLADRKAEPAEVLRIIERALAYNPKEPRAHLVLGRLARDQRQFAEAVRHFELAFRAMPEFGEAQRLLAETLLQLGLQRVLAKDDDAALVAFLRCREVAPDGFERAGLDLQLARLWRHCEERGLERRRAGDRVGAIADFRRCLEIDPQQHWAAWLLANTMAQQPDPELAEIERLARLAVAWQQRHGLDRSQPVWLLCDTLRKRGDAAAAAALARDYLAAPDATARPPVLAALRQWAGD